MNTFVRINAFKSESVPEESWYKGPTLKQKYFFIKNSLTERNFFPLYHGYISFITHLDTGFRGIQKQEAVADECQLNLISFMYSLLSLTFLMNSLICRETEEVMKTF